jgi:LPS-assembly lipoprotein
MSSPDRSRLKALAGLGLALLVAGCNFHPLYAPTLAAPGGVAPVLAAIDIAHIDTRIGQRLRNELIFRFTGGSAPATPRYRLTIVVSTVETPLALGTTGQALADQIVATANYTLSSIRDQRPVLTDTTTARASYDRSVQRFAAYRAKLDAENRAMDTLADLIYTQLAAALASGQIPPPTALAPVAAPATPPAPGPRPGG